MIPPIFELASSCAARRPSLTAAWTISASISASSGSIASGSIEISRRVRSPPIFTLTMPPPALASTDLVFELLLRLQHLVLHLLRLFHQGVHVEASGHPPPRAT